MQRIKPRARAWGVAMWVATITAATVTGLPAVARGQAGGGQDKDDGALGPRVEAREMLSAQFTRSAINALQRRDGGKPRSDQYIRSQILLDMAVKLSPRDPQLRQLQGELASYTEEPARQREALSAYLKLVPDDDAAQLKLVTMKLDSLPTLDKRLATVKRVLDTAGAGQLSEALRSRLAAYAAAAAKELGDDQAFTRWLGVATQADPTNAQAANMMVRLARERHAAPQLLGATVVKQIQASPMAAGPRVALANLLLEQGAFNDAAGQYQVAANFNGRPLSARAYRRWFQALACAGRLSDALSLADQLNQLLGQDKAAATGGRGGDSSAAEGAQAGGGDGGGGAQGGGAQAAKGQAPADAGGNANADAPSDTASADNSSDTARALPLDMRIKQAIILSMNGQEGRLQTLLGPLRKALTEKAQAGDRAAALDLASLLLALDRDSDAAGQWLDKAEDSPRRRALRGLLAVRREQPQEAHAMLDPLADQQPAAAYGRAILSSVDGPGRAGAMARLARRMPRSTFGMAAAIQAAQGDRAVTPTGPGTALLQTMSRQPSRLWSMDMKDHPWIELSVTAQPGRFGYLEPIPLKLRIRNITQIPLSLGPGRTVPTRVFVNVSPSARGRVLGTLPPIVTDLGRRLTLGPNQSLSYTVRLDRSVFGSFIASRPFTSMRFNATAISDPRTDRRGAMVPGPLGSRQTVRSLQAWTLPPSEANIKDWLDGLDSHDDAEQLQSIAWLAALNPKANNAPIDLATAQRIAERLSEVYREFGPVRQAWTVIRSAQPDDGRATLTPIYNQAKKSDQPMVRIAYLLSHVQSPDAPALADAIKSQNTQVRRFALAVKAGLKQSAAETEAEAGAGG